VVVCFIIFKYLVCSLIVHIIDLFSINQNIIVVKTFTNEIFSPCEIFGDIKFIYVVEVFHIHLNQLELLVFLQIKPNLKNT